MAEWALAALILVCAAFGALAAIASADPPAQTTLTVTLGGDGAGTITSVTAGISCTTGTCTAPFDPATSVALTATPRAGSTFTGFGNACAGLTCTVLMSTDATVTANFDLVPTITAPANGTAYPEASVPAAAFACAPGDTSCTAKLDGQPIVSGGALSAVPGPHTLSVAGVAADGAPVSQTASYTVHPPPTCSDVGASTNEGAAVRMRLSCSDPHAPSVNYVIDAGPHGGTLGRAQPLITYTPRAGFAGIDSFTYHGTSADGNSASHTATIAVLAPPTAQITAPAAGQVYAVGQSVPTRFACADDSHAPGLRSCTDSGGASGGTGVLNTTTEGNHSYTITAMSRDGQTGRAAIAYTVVGKSPQVVVTAPVNNAAYLWTAIPAADFTCVPGAGSSVQSCKATVGGQPVSDHQPLPNSFGAHVLTVTATDADGLSATVSVTYTVTVTVASLPPVSIEAPRQGARYLLGETVAARYSCLATTTGPVLKSCVGTVRAGHRVDTATLGAHSFSVSATNDQGESTTEIVSYKVVPTTNRFVVKSAHATPSGTARLQLKLPGPGAVKVVALAWNAARRASRHRLVYGTASVTIRRAGRVVIVVAPSDAARALLHARGARPVIAFTVTYRPTGARPRVVRPKPLHLA
jgi:hypothetical protein